MKNTDAVLKLLFEHKNEAVSGNEIAKKLNISRTAVWKIVTELKKSGFTITSSTNKGYTYLASGTAFKEEIGMYTDKNVMFLDSVDSTNNLAKRLCAEKKEIPDAVVSLSQTGGRGRLGRSFCSPKGNGVYISVILKPENLETAGAILVTSAAAVAVKRAIYAASETDAEIKWVNDIYIKGKKVSGILTEAVSNFETGKIDYVIVGVGINIRNKKEFPAELTNIITTLEDECKKSVNASYLAAKVIDNIFLLCQNPNADDFMDEYEKSSCVIGKRINVIRGSERYSAKAVGINRMGELLAECDDGEIRVLNSGEITIRL